MSSVEAQELAVSDSGSKAEVAGIFAGPVAQAGLVLLLAVRPNKRKTKVTTAPERAHRSCPSAGRQRGRPTPSRPCRGGSKQSWERTGQIEEMAGF